jgi:hypothetical protein
MMRYLTGVVEAKIHINKSGFVDGGFFVSETKCTRDKQYKRADVLSGMWLKCGE